MDISGSPVPAELPVELRRSRRRLLGGGYLSGGLAVGALSLLAGFIALPILSLVIWTEQFGVAGDDLPSRGRRPALKRTHHGHQHVRHPAGRNSRRLRAGPL